MGKVEVVVDPNETADSFSFDYTVRDAVGVQRTAKVHVEVFVVPPLGADNSFTLSVNATHTVSPLANDNAPEGSTIQTVDSLTGAVSGTTVAINADDVRVDVTIAEAQAGVPFSFQYTADGPGVDPWTQTVSVTVPEEETPPAGDFDNRPYQGVLYGSAIAMGRGYADTRLRRSGNNAIQMYFVAPRSGNVTHWQQHRRVDGTNSQNFTTTWTSSRTGQVVTDTFSRTNPSTPGSSHSTSYSRGMGGRYNVYIYPADPVTRRRIPNSNPLGQKFGWEPTTILKRASASTGDLAFGWPEFMWPIVPFDNPIPLVAGNSYVLVWDNVTTLTGGASGNYVSCNTSPVAISNIAQSPPSFIGASGSGWTPAAAFGGINGKDWYPWTELTEQGSLRWLRIGPSMLGFRWSDGLVTQYSGAGGAQRDASSGLVREILTSSKHMRERFRPSFDGLVVNGVWFYAWRNGSQSGNVVITVEQGPSSDTSGNGTMLREVSTSINSLTNVGSSFSIGPSDTPDKVSWVFLPFNQLSLPKGTIFNVRLRVSGSGQFNIGANEGPEHASLQWSPRGLTSWAEHEELSTRSLEMWKDSRGTMISTNGGSSWSYIGGLNRRVAPICFRCVL